MSVFVQMERDALLSHGVAFCLHDRLMNCSDSHLAYACASCGGFLSVHALSSGGGGFGGGLKSGKHEHDEVVHV